MAEKMSLGGNTPASPKPSKNKDAGSPLSRQVGTPVITALGVLLLIGLVAAGFYAYNGGWKTDAQKDEQFKHETMPLLQASRGMTEALDRENQYRKEHGQPPLEMPKDRHESAEGRRQKLMELQQKLNGQHNTGQ